MRGGFLSAFQRSAVNCSVAGRALVLSIGLSPLLVGCGDKSTANKSEPAAAPTTASAPPGMSPTGETPKLMAVPETRSAVGDRYTEAPRFPTTTGPYPPKTIADPNVQPASYGASPRVPTGTQRAPQAPVLEPSATPSEAEFIRGVEDLQQFEQKADGSAPPKGWWGSDYIPNPVGGVRANPLPLSP